jgi:hypothetical protein
MQASDHRFIDPWSLVVGKVGMHGGEPHVLGRGEALRFLKTGLGLIDGHDGIALLGEEHGISPLAPAADCGQVLVQERIGLGPIIIGVRSFYYTDLLTSGMHDEDVRRQG